MKNRTVQQVLNAGYRLLQTSFFAPASTPVQITAVDDTNKIVLMANTAAGLITMGAFDVDARGLPLNYKFTYFDGSTGVDIYLPICIEILTTQPDGFYLYTGSLSAELVTVMYLTEI